MEGERGRMKKGEGGTEGEKNGKREGREEGGRKRD